MTQVLDLKGFIASKEITQKEFSEATGINKFQLSRIINGKIDLSIKYKRQIIAVYPDFEKYYATFKQLKSNNSASISDKISKDTRLVPLINRYAYASFVEEWDHPEWLDEQSKIPTQCPDDGNYLWFEIRGDSMSRQEDTSINEGDHILARELYRQHWVSLQYKRVPVWVIVHKHRGVMVKEVIDQDNHGNLTLHSWNPFFEDFKINLNDIMQIYYFKELRKVFL